MVRQFRLINELNEIYDLMDIKHFLNNPTGLGNTPIQRYESYNGYVTMMQDAIAPMTISGTIIFRVGENEPYKRYYELMDYLAKSQNVYMEYQAPGFEFVRAEISKNISISKSEINGTNMACAVEFLRLEDWKSNEVTSEAITFEVEEGKEYEYDYEYSYEESVTSSFDITNNSFLPVPLKITFESPYVNPMIEVISVLSGQLIGKWQWLGEVHTNEVLVSNGMGNHMEQSTTLNNSNVYQELNLDVGFSSYVYIPRGDFKLKFSSDSTTMGKAVISYKGNWNTL